MSSIIEEKEINEVPKKKEKEKEKEKETETTKKEPETFVYEKKPSLYVFVGKPASGKSVGLKQIMYQHFKNDYFKFGIAICQTKFNLGYDFLPDNLVWPSYNEERLKAYVQKMEAWMKQSGKKKPPPNFIVLDDCLGDINQASAFFKNFMACYRHYNTTVFITAQYLATGISTQLRDSTTMAFIFSTKFGRSKQILHEAYGSSLKFDEFEMLLENSTDEKYYCLVFVNDKQKHNTFHCFKSQVAPTFKVSFDQKKKKLKPGLETQMEMFKMMHKR
jgi:hypothetical protein